MTGELKNIFDDISKRIAEEEYNTIAKAFTMYIGDVLIRNGIKPILRRVEMPYTEYLSQNEYQIVSRYGYIFDKMDTSEHDKQIRDEVISIIHDFFRNELDKLEVDHDEDEYYKDTYKVDELLSMNKRLCKLVRGDDNE